MSYNPRIEELERKVNAMPSGAEVPQPSGISDAGKVMTVNETGTGYELIEPADGLPEVTSADNGDVLAVVDGAWAKADPPSGGGIPALAERISVSGGALTFGAIDHGRTEASYQDTENIFDLLTLTSGLLGVNTISVTINNETITNTSPIKVNDSTPTTIGETASGWSVAVKVVMVEITQDANYVIKVVVRLDGVSSLDEITSATFDGCTLYSYSDEFLLLYYS